MWSTPQRIVRLRLTLLESERPIERVVELDAEARLECLHELIQDVFTWAGRSRHIFVDLRSCDRREPWGGLRTQRVWELDHGCRDHGHTSMCGWTSSVADVLRACVNAAGTSELYYEYAVSDGRRAHDYFDGCALQQFGACRDDWPHGWTIAIELLGERKPVRNEELPTVLGGSGRAPFEETGGARGDTALNAVLDDPAHALHSQLDEWARTLAGPWAECVGRAFDPDRFDSSVVAEIAGDRSDAYGTGTRFADRAGLPARLASAASAIPRRHRVDVLCAAKEIVFEHPASVEPGKAQPATVQQATAQPAIAALDALLDRTATGLPTEADHRDSATAVNLVFARKLRLVVRRAGEYRLTRAGEQARSDPVALMNACVEGYWRASRSGDDATGLYVLMGVERGLAGDELIALVAAALASDQAEPRRGSGEWDGGWDGRGRYGEPDGFAAVRQIEECASFLARFGAFSIDGDRTVVTANAAALVLAFLTR